MTIPAERHIRGQDVRYSFRRNLAPLKARLARAHQSGFMIQPGDLTEGFATNSALLSLVPFRQHGSNEAVLGRGFDLP